LGYLQYDGKFFRLQPRILSLASGYSDSAPLPRVGQPILSAARDVLGESVSLAVLDGDSAFFIARAEAERLVSSGVTVGARAPAYCSSTGRVLLAGLTDEQVLAYLERTSVVVRTKYTRVDKDDIFAIVRKAREEGYAVSIEEMELGLLSIAVPVYDSRRILVGAMSASASSARVRLSSLTKKFLPVLRDHAVKLGRAL
jgi:IclR family transcriptional regulator, pca regulon regulatory protein